eukprot:scaffold75171_cov78-Cyclotella_meneghiniana.AAC.3
MRNTSAKKRKSRNIIYHQRGSSIKQSSRLKQQERKATCASARNTEYNITHPCVVLPCTCFEEYGSLRSPKADSYGCGMWVAKEKARILLKFALDKCDKKAVEIN